MCLGNANCTCHLLQPVAWLEKDYDTDLQLRPSFSAGGYGLAAEGMHTVRVAGVHHASGVHHTTYVQPMIALKDDASCEPWHEPEAEYACPWMVAPDPRDVREGRDDLMEDYGPTIKFSDYDESWRVARL